MQYSPVFADADLRRYDADPAAQRELILATARDLLRDADFAGFTLDRIAIRTGLSRRAVAAHFEDRIDLYRACRMALLDRFVPRLPLEAAADPADSGAIARFVGSAIVVLGCQEHREFAASVARDGKDHPWVTGIYDDYVAVPLRRTIERLVLAEARRRQIALDDAAGVAADVLRMINASISGDDQQALLTPDEIALIVGTRIACAAVPGPASTGGRPTQGPSPANAPMIRRSKIRRGAITLTADPSELRWNDIHVPLSRLEADLAAEIIRRGRVSWDDVNAVLAARGASTVCRDVLIYRIRRKLGALGAADPFQTVRGWGIKLRPEYS